jgi:hypothetical protein
MDTKWVKIIEERKKKKKRKKFKPPLACLLHEPKNGNWTGGLMVGQKTNLKQLLKLTIIKL